MPKPAFDPNQPFESGAGGTGQAQKPAFDPNQPFEPSMVEPASGYPGKGLVDLGQKSLGLLGTGLKAVDSVTGAPTRAAISAAQNADTPSDIVPSAYKAFKGQFGDMSHEAPTGEDIVKRAGVPEGIPSKVAGFGMDMAANPLNALGPAAKLAGKAAEYAAPAAEALSTFSHEKALKAAGAMTKDFRVINDKGLQDSLGSFLLDKEMVTPLSTVSKVAERLSTAKQSAGETIGHILDTADAGQTVKIKAADIALSLAQDPEILALKNIPGQEATAKQVNRSIQTLFRNGNELSLRDAQKLRQGIDSSINFNKRASDMAGAQPHLYKMRDKISQAMSDAIDAIDSGQPAGGGAPGTLPGPSSPEALGRLKEANQAYSKLATLEKIADARAGAISSNRGISLTDTIAGAGGLALGHTPMGAAAAGAGLAVANKAGRTFGNPLMATGARGAAKAVKAAPGLLSSVPNAAGPAVSGAMGLLNKKGNK
jgi:hypothetical protein